MLCLGVPHSHWLIHYYIINNIIFEYRSSERWHFHELAALTEGLRGGGGAEEGHSGTCGYNAGPVDVHVGGHAHRRLVVQHWRLPSGTGTGTRVGATAGVQHRTHTSQECSPGLIVVLSESAFYGTVRNDFDAATES